MKAMAKKTTKKTSSRSTKKSSTQRSAQEEITPQSPREKLIATANELFYSKGISNVGINEIIQAAGVARMTLYNNFKSKEALVKEVLSMRAEKRASKLNTIFESGADPKKQLNDIVTMFANAITSAGYRGDPLNNASVELGADAKLVTKLHAEQKETLRSNIESLAKKAKLAKAKRLSQSLMLLLDGATVAAQARDPNEVAKELKAAAKDLMS